MNLNPVAAALIVGLLLSAAVEAAAAEKTKVPQSVPATTPPGTVTLDKMDDATQQNLGRGAVNTAPANPGKADGSLAVRDWASIDTNKDQLISPSEMEAFLVVAHGKSGGR